MNSATLILVYIIGTAGMFTRAVLVDTVTAGKLSNFRSYLILALIWPVTVWIWMYLFWLEKRDEHRARKAVNRDSM